MKNLLIADDHPIFRTGLKDILFKEYPTAKIIECGDGEQAYEEMIKYRPDIAILDIDMPKDNGLEVTKKVLKEWPDARIVILTMYREKEMIRKAMLTGAKGYLLKDFAVNELIDCIEKVSHGQNYIGPALQSHAYDIHTDDRKKQELISQIHSLSQAELKTLKLVSQNLSTKDIAERLFLSDKTIENYRSRICQKLGLPPRNNSLVLWINENREILSAISEF